jgi:uncharacterized MAPEG superfamily protein
MMSTGLTIFTSLHVLISLIGIVAGFIAMIGWLKSDPAPIATAVFLATTILTSASGFLFPFVKLLPSHIVGIISLVLLAFATFALYGRRLSGIWRPIYTVTALLSLYLNVFVLIVQAFLKIPPLKEWAPTQTEPAFLVAQGLAFLIFLVLTILTTAKFHPIRLAAEWCARYRLRAVAVVSPVKFTPELYSLAIISTATALMWAPYVFARMMTHGVMQAISNPGPDYPVDAPWADRARRAHLNAIENLVVFAPLVLVGAMAEVSTLTTIVSARVYVVARLAHYAIYVAGIPAIRTVAFLAGASATLVIGFVLILSGT